MRRFEQLKSQFRQIESMLPIDIFSHVYVSALTAEFDSVFDLSWKTLKEYLHKDLGIVEAKTGSPLIILQLACREGLLADGEAWEDLLIARTDDIRVYNERAAMLYADAIMTKYVVLIRDLIKVLSEIIPSEEFKSEAFPADFIALVEQSGEGYYEVANRIAIAEGYRSTEEVFVNWENIKDKYTCEKERLILKNDRFVVVRDFYKIGSLILEYNKETHRRFVGDANTLRSIATGNIQVIPMGGPNAKDVYSEYKPYTVVPIDQIDDVINMVLKGDLPLEVNIYMKDNPYVTK